MKSIQTKLLALVLLCVLLSCLVTGSVGLFSAQQAVDEDSARIMNVLCEAEAARLDALLTQVELSVKILVEHAQDQIALDEAAWTDAARVDECVMLLEREAMHFARNIRCVQSIHVRLLPALAEEDHTYVWHAPNKDDGQEEHSIWGTGSTYIPSEGMWLDPESRAAFDSWAAAYVAPVAYNGQTVGIIGMDVDTVAVEAMMENIALYQTGYAFLTDKSGVILYHPDLASGMSAFRDDEQLQDAASEMLSGSSGEMLVSYKWGGARKAMAFRTLKNGMHLAVTAPMKEINAGRNGLVIQNICAMVLIVLLALVVTTGFTHRIIYPLQELDMAAQKIAGGDFSVRIEPHTDDELGTLARSFQKTSDQLQRYIGELNSLAYRDSMTGVRNKSAYLEAAMRMQERMETEDPIFALIMLDVNYLKLTNDRYGHEYGDKLIVGGCRIICSTFEHSPVYRFGGDEFVVILENRDFDDREMLMERFCQTIEGYNHGMDGRMKLSMSWGMAVYDKKTDKTFNDVFKRADDNMYENKKATYAAEGMENR